MTDLPHLTALADSLRGLTTPQLVEVMRQVLSARHDSRNGVETALLLAEVSWMTGEPHRWAEEEEGLRLVAWPDVAEEGERVLDRRRGLFDSGRCSLCQAFVVSTIKTAPCPVCGNLCHLT